MNKFPPTVSNGIKHISPTINSFKNFYFARTIIVSRVFQYFIVGMSLIDTIENISTSVADLTIHFLPKICKSFHPQNFPNKDMVIFDISF